MLIVLLKIYRDTNVKNSVGTPNLAQDNQAIKRQKLEGGRTRQVNLKACMLTIVVSLVCYNLKAFSFSYTFRY
jgi:hypothetical protein